MIEELHNIESPEIITLVIIDERNTLKKNNEAVYKTNTFYPIGNFLFPFDTRSC